MIAALFTTVFAVLGIILFFKIWKMTADIKLITEQLSYIYTSMNRESNDDPIDNILFCIYNNRRQEALDLLQRQMWKHAGMQNIREAHSAAEFTEGLEKLKREYGKYYDMLGEPFPTFAHMSPQK